MVVLAPILLFIAIFFSNLSSSLQCAMERGSNTWCGCGAGKTALGPCIGGDCPEGYTCVCDYCCEGCFDDCYDCALYTQYCENTNYCDLRQKCKRTCGLCVDPPPPNGNG